MAGEYYDVLFNKLYSDLQNVADVMGVKDLKAYFKPHGGVRSHEIFRSFAIALQGSTTMQSKIKMNDEEGENYKIVRDVLFDFDVYKSADTYSTWEDIYKAILDAGIKDEKPKEDKDTPWQKYSKGLFDGITLFYKKVDGRHGVDRIRSLVYVDVCELDDDEMGMIIDTIKAISKKIRGMGFALTCEWLKECGCTYIAKPEAFLKKTIEYIVDPECERTVKDEEVLKEVFKWVKTTNAKRKKDKVTAYQIDRIIYLLCTGDFYLDSCKFGREIVNREIDSLRQDKEDNKTEKVDDTEEAEGKDK